MKPYKNITSHNLGLLLLLTRVTVYVGFLLTLVAIFASVVIFFKSGIYSVIPVLSFIPKTVFVLFFSGFMAAIVAFEESYRKRTEQIVNGKA